MFSICKNSLLLCLLLDASQHVSLVVCQLVVGFLWCDVSFKFSSQSEEHCLACASLLGRFFFSLLFFSSPFFLTASFVLLSLRKVFWPTWAFGVGTCVCLSLRVKGPKETHTNASFPPHLLVLTLCVQVLESLLLLLLRVILLHLVGKSCATVAGAVDCSWKFCSNYKAAVIDFWCWFDFRATNIK